MVSKGEPVRHSTQIGHFPHIRQHRAASSAFSLFAYCWLPGGLALHYCPAWLCLCTADQDIPIVLPHLGLIYRHTYAILYQTKNMKINCFYIDKLKMSKPEEYLTKKLSNLKLLLLEGNHIQMEKLFQFDFHCGYLKRMELPLLHKCQIPVSQYTSVHTCINT